MTIMDRGLRERRAQIRAQKRAERLKAREGRSRSVRKSDDFMNPGGDPFDSYTPKGVKNHYGYISRKARKEILDETKEADKNTGRVTSSTHLPDMSLEAINSRMEKEKDTKEREKHAAEFVGKINKDNSINNYQVPTKYATIPTGTMAENAARDKRKAAQSEHEARREEIIADDSLSDDEKLAARRESLEARDSKLEDATAENLQERAVYDPEKVVPPESDEQREVREQAKRDRLAEGAARTAERYANDENRIIDLKDDVTTDVTGEVAVSSDQPMSGTTGGAKDDAYAKEMAQKKYNIMRDNAGKFLTAMAGAAVDNIDKVNTAGWDLAGNMIKTMFTRPEALSSTSRIIGSAMTMTDTLDRMAEDTSKRYGIAVQADPELVKDTIKYKAYKRAKKDDGHVMGNAMRVMDNTLRSMGVQDITQLDSAQLMDYKDVLTDEMSRLRNLLEADDKVRQGDRSAGLRREMSGMLKDAGALIRPGRHSYDSPGWDGRLRGDDRNLLMRTYNVLTDHMKELDKQSSVLSREEKARIAEARVKQKEKRKEQYKVSPIGWALEAVYPGFTMDVNSNTGLPIRVEDWGKLERYIASELAAAEQSGNFIRPREDYEKALKYIKDAKQKTHEARHMDVVATYKASPIEWALRAAFPSFKTPVNEATGLPARLSDYERLSSTIRTMMHQDKESGEFRHSLQEYQDALDMIARSKEAITDRKRISKVSALGSLAEEVVRQTPAAAKGILSASQTGRWSNAAKPTAEYLRERMHAMELSYKRAKVDPRWYPDYKAAYCMYNSALLSMKVTNIMNRIAPIMMDSLEKGGISKEEQEADLRTLSSILYEMRDAYPVDGPQAANIVDLKKSDDRGRVAEKRISAIWNKYKILDEEEKKQPQDMNEDIGGSEAVSPQPITSEDLKGILFTQDDAGNIIDVDDYTAAYNLFLLAGKRGIKLNANEALDWISKFRDSTYFKDIEDDDGPASDNASPEQIISVTADGKEVSDTSTDQNNGVIDLSNATLVSEDNGGSNPRKRTHKDYKDLVLDADRQKLVDAIKEDLGKKFQNYFEVDENGNAIFNKSGQIRVKDNVSIVKNGLNKELGLSQSPFGRIFYYLRPKKAPSTTSESSDPKPKLTLKDMNNDEFIAKNLNLLGRFENKNDLAKIFQLDGMIGPKDVRAFNEKLRKRARDEEKNAILSKFDALDKDFLGEMKDEELRSILSEYATRHNDSNFKGIHYEEPTLKNVENLAKKIYGGDLKSDKGYLEYLDRNLPARIDAKIKGLFARAYVQRMLDNLPEDIFTNDSDDMKNYRRYLEAAYDMWGDYIRSGAESPNSLESIKSTYANWNPDARGEIVLSNLIKGDNDKDLSSESKEYRNKYGEYDDALRKYLNLVPHKIATPVEVPPVEEASTEVAPVKDASLDNSGGDAPRPTISKDADQIQSSKKEEDRANKLVRKINSYINAEKGDVKPSLSGTVMSVKKDLENQGYLVKDGDETNLVKGYIMTTNKKDLNIIKALLDNYRSFVEKGIISPQIEESAKESTEESTGGYNDADLDDGVDINNI